MLDQVRRTIAKYGLLRGGERVIIGFSGGIDSVCLAHVLKSLTELDLKLWAVYIDYGLRPAENRRETALLQDLGTRFGIETIRYQVNIPERLLQKKESIQLLAREERYRLFRQCKAEVGADKIAVGHHRDDQAETIFWRLIRGTGLDGLTGMPIDREDGVIRPLLEVNRSEIRKYMQENQLAWIEDSSNQKLVYRRNILRHRLIPEIETTLNPRFKEALIRLSALAGEQQELIDSLTVREADRVLIRESDRIGLRLDRFHALPQYLQYQLLKYAVTQVRPGLAMESASLFKLRDRLKSTAKTWPPYLFQKGLFVSGEGDVAYLGKAGERRGLIPVKYPAAAPGTTDIPEAGVRLCISRAEIPADWRLVTEREAYFSGDNIRLPLQVRFWRHGDWFWPLGAAGTQKLQDFFINRKVPRCRRGVIPLLVDAADKIVWVAGYRLDNRFKVKDSDAEVWRADITPRDP